MPGLLKKPRLDLVAFPGIQDGVAPVATTILRVWQARIEAFSSGGGKIRPKIICHARCSTVIAVGPNSQAYLRPRPGD